jgi:hypothetical protein
MKRRITGLFLLLLAWLCFSSAARACGCIVSFVQYQPCSAYWTAGVVFAGTVTELGPMIPVAGSNGQLFTPNGRFTRFRIEEGFRGVTGETIDTFEHGTSCDYHFKPGERYLVYASRDPKDGRIYVSSCSATKTLENAEADLTYARGVMRGEPTPSIVGIVARETRSKATEYRQKVYPEGIRVIAKGPENLSKEVFTDAKGVFQFFGLPAGDYQVRALTTPDLRRLYGDEILRVKVVDGRCTGGQFTVTTLSTIRGRVLDSKGMVLKTRVDLVPLDSDGNEISAAEGSIETSSDEQGKYKFDGVAPGRYLVAVNSFKQPGSYDPPYHRTYLPGLTDRARASIIEITEGQQVTVDDFVLGPPLTTRTIEGVVQMPDGTPAANALIKIEFTERNWIEIGSADAQGRFQMKVFEGFKYIVTAELRKEVQGVWRARHSPEVEFTAGPINQPITLIISVDGFHRPRYARRRATGN